MAYITIITGPDRGRKIELTDAQPQLTIGRESCDVILPDAAVSRQHAQLSLCQGQWHLADLDSSNGTFVNETRITRQIALVHNDQIRCGATVLLFDAPSAAPAGERPAAHAGDERAETMVGLTFGTLVPKSSARRQQRAAAAGFAALNISHGIKNLIQTVTSGREVVDCALRINDIDRARRGWTILNRSLDQINRLILDLLKFSRDTQPAIKDCPLNQLLAQLVETAQAETERKNAAIALRTDDRIQNVPLDPDLIAEALLNLILNAVEAVEPRQGRIEVTTQLDEPNRRVLITCRDNGCGIADTHIIFEPFHTAGKKTGTGLGLPIAKKIIEQHKGTIAVQSRPGQGAIFTVTLPTTSTPSAAEETS